MLDLSYPADENRVLARRGLRLGSWLRVVLEERREFHLAPPEVADLDLLRLGMWKLAIYDFRNGSIEVVQGQGGHSLNPQWAPDGSDAEAAEVYSAHLENILRLRDHHANRG